MEFFSIPPEEAADLIQGSGGEVPEGGFPAEQWFPAEDGLATVRGLLGYIVASPRAVADRKANVSDLQEFERFF